MTAILVPIVLAAALVATAAAGPLIIRSAAPVLMRAPRAAVALLLAAGTLWLLASAALSLMLTWLVNGPAVLPGALAGVCQRCLSAASPFASIDTIDTVIPVGLLVALPAVGSAVLAGSAAVRGVRRHRSTAAVARSVAARAESTVIGGREVLLTQDLHPAAFSLSRRQGGIVISRGLIAGLRPDELTAVLAHEGEHVRGRHHLVLAVLDVVFGPLRWIPLMTAIRSAVPLYLEIAADEAARRSTGTPALASALLKLGDAAAGRDPSRAGLVLHAAGPDRIGQLVSPPRIGQSIVPAVTLAAVAAAFAFVAAVVHGPYISAVITGCHLVA